jgi:hypothetical protein
MSMAAGEYVSVHSQADTEQAELDLERTELKADDRGEHKELAAGSGLIRTPLTTLKMAVVAPMPSASVIRAIEVNIGARQNRRKTCLSDFVKGNTPQKQFGSERCEFQLTGRSVLGNSGDTAMALLS